MSQVLLGLDLGTTGARALAVTPGGEVVAEATASYPLLTPRPGWTEQRPDDWFNRCIAGHLVQVALDHGRGVFRFHFDSDTSRTRGGVDCTPSG